MFLSKLFVGGILCFGCGVPVAVELIKGGNFKAGEFEFFSLGGAKA